MVTSSRRSRCSPVFLIVALASPAGWASAQATVPYVFTPSGADDSASLRDALIQYRWVQIDGPDVRIDAPINLEDQSGQPLHNVVIEPIPGLPSVRVHTGIQQNSGPFGSDPSRSVLNYNGGFSVGGFLTAPVGAGEIVLRVRDPRRLVHEFDGYAASPFEPDQYVCLSDTSRVESLDSAVAREARDGALESRRITHVLPSAEPDEMILLVDAPLRRSHAALVAATHCRPIERVTIRNLRFTSDGGPGPRAGIHLHTAFGASLSGITSEDWRGFALILIDAGGRGNTVSDSFAVGVNTATDCTSGWGIALEGQEHSLIVNSGAERHCVGIVINWSISTLAVNSRVSQAEFIGLDVNSDTEGNPSIDSGYQGGSVAGGGLGANIGPNCQNCVINASFEHTYSAVKVGQGAIGSQVQGHIEGFSGFAVGIDSIYGGIGDGAVSSKGTYLNMVVTCATQRLVLLKGPFVSDHAPSAQDPYYSFSTAFSGCP